MKEYLKENGFDEVVKGLWLRSPARIDITENGIIYWLHGEKREVDEAELKKCIESTAFRTKLKK